MLLDSSPPPLEEGLGGGDENFPLPFIPSRQGRGGFFVGCFSNKRGDLS